MYLPTTPLEMPRAAAIRSWERRASSLRRKTSLILHMLILGAGTPVSGKARQATPHGVNEMRNPNTLTYGSVPLP